MKLSFPLFNKAYGTILVEYIRLIRQKDHTGITKVEYKHQDQKKNKKGYVDFDRVGNIKI